MIAHGIQCFFFVVGHDGMFHGSWVCDERSEGILLMLVTSGFFKGNIGKWRFQFSHPQKFLGVPEIPADFPAATGSESVEAAGNPQEFERFFSTHK